MTALSFISGFIGLCSAVSAGAVTEISVAGYSRQAIAFSNPANGASVNVGGFDFGLPGVQGTAGRAIWSAPIGGALLAVLPHASTRLPQGGSADRGDAGYITLIISALATFPDGTAFTGTFSAGATLGLVYDRDEIVGWSSTAPNPASGVTVLPRGGQFLAVRASPLTAGVALAVSRGLLQAA